ncbi:MAG: nuclear transport factor 2 family protein [Pseudomonadales bacterium]|nr:nuclear transport factor 2 family protein [Pseudomonadales bacterium]MCP5185055.1 nuclear transport factor 2 family protein [Pseudomonadales bacterium]
MNSLHPALAADTARRQAMVGQDVAALTALLDENLVWTHSSGRTDNRAAVIDSIASRSVVYHTLDAEDIRVLPHGDVAILHGTINGHVSKDGAGKALRNRFLSVWKQTGGAWRMLAWQSTSC